MNIVRFALFGPGKISHRVVAGMEMVEEMKLCAVASRSIERSEKFKETYHLEKAYGSYEECLQDKDIDAIYLATPPHTHFDLVMLCLKHGKHVICEKPFMVHASQVKEAFAYAKAHHLMLMEAYKGVFLPSAQKVKQWITEGMIGELKYMEGSYCYEIDIKDKSHWVFQKEYGGGGLYDVGIYPLAYLNYMAGSKVEEIKSMSIMNSCGVDDMTQVLIRYENQVMASIRGGIGFDTCNSAYIYGTKGFIEIPYFWKGETAYLHVYDDIITFEEEHYKREFQYQIRAFVHDILNGRIEDPIMSEEASIQNVSIMEASVGLDV